MVLEDEIGGGTNQDSTLLQILLFSRTHVLRCRTITAHMIVLWFTSNVHFTLQLFLRNHSFRNRTSDGGSPMHSRYSYFRGPSMCAIGYMPVRVNSKRELQ